MTRNIHIEAENGALREFVEQLQSRVGEQLIAREPGQSIRRTVVLRALSAARFLPEEDVWPVPGSRSGCPAWVADNG